MLCTSNDRFAMFGKWITIPDEIPDEIPVFGQRSQGQSLANQCSMCLILASLKSPRKRATNKEQTLP